jgi:hypothetical protein
MASYSTQNLQVRGKLPGNQKLISPISPLKHFVSVYIRCFDDEPEASSKWCQRFVAAERFGAVGCRSGRNVAQKNQKRDWLRQSPIPYTSFLNSLLERFHGGRFVVFYVENGVQLGDLQQVVDLLGQVEQFQFAALVFDRGESADQFADA